MRDTVKSVMMNCWLWKDREPSPVPNPSGTNTHFVFAPERNEEDTDSTRADSIRSPSGKNKVKTEDIARVRKRKDLLSHTLLSFVTAHDESTPPSGKNKVKTENITRVPKRKEMLSKEVVKNEQSSLVDR